MRLINLTTNPIYILDRYNHSVFRVIAPSGKFIQVESEIVPAGIVDDIPLTRIEFVEPEGLPEEQDGIYYIVSHLVQSALPDRDDLLIPAEIIRDKGVITGYLSLGR